MKIINKNRQEKGITLIALVVTIVVLLILAGITINLVFADGGILQKASDAADRQKEAEEGDKAAIEELAEQANTILNGGATGGEGNSGEGIETTATTKPYLPSSSFSVSTKERENTLADGLVIKDESGNEYVWIEVPTSIYENTKYNKQTADNDMKPANETDYEKIRYCLQKYLTVDTNYRKSNYEDYWYYTVSGTTYSKDPLTGDEYKNNAKKTASDTYTVDTSKNDGCGLTYAEYTNLYKAMLKSVYKNGGFYIGRYEAGMDAGLGYKGEGTTAIDFRTDKDKNESLSSMESFKPYSQRNKYPINYVTCSDSQKVASRVAPSGYNSSLMFGMQWDLVIKYLETKIGASNLTVDGMNILTQDSKSWGNYQTSIYTITDIAVKYSTNYGSSYTPVTTAVPLDHTTNKKVLLTTGASENFKKQNIYDLAGNEYEWTLERASYGAGSCAVRGGNFGFGGSDCPASVRDYYSPTDAGNLTGLRVALY